MFAKFSSKKFRRRRKNYEFSIKTGKIGRLSVFFVPVYSRVYVVLYALYEYSWFTWPAEP